MARQKKDVAAEEVNTEENNGNSLDINLAISSIEKDFGKGSIMLLGKHEQDHPIKHISSGSLALDSILGGGGFPFGRIVEISGPEMGGKTTLVLELIARAQKLGLVCALIDIENSLNPAYARMVGVDTEKLIFAQPNSGNEALAIINRLASLGKIDLIALDSIAACAPEAEIAKEMTENPQMGLLPAMLSRFFRVTTPVFNKNECLFVATNQLREKVGMMFGNPEITPGGRAMKFSATQRLSVRVKEKILGSEGEVIGNTLKITTIKNKMNSPYREANVDIIFGHGFDKEKDLIVIATEVGILEKSGTWYSYNGENLAQGIVGLKSLFKEKPELMQEIREKTVAIIGPNWGKEGK